MESNEKPEQEARKEPVSGHNEQNRKEEKSGRTVVWMYAIGIVIGLPLIYQLAKYVLANTTM